MTAISYTLPQNGAPSNTLSALEQRLSSVSSSTAGQVTRMLSDRIEDDVHVTSFRAKSSAVATVMDVLERLLSPLVPGIGAQIDIRA